MFMWQTFVLAQEVKQIKRCSLREKPTSENDLCDHVANGEDWVAKDRIYYSN